MSLKRLSQYSYTVARRVIVTVVGATVCLIGIIMIFVPGPATLVIPAGLAILGLEFAFARRWLKSIRQKISDTLSSDDISDEEDVGSDYDPWNMWQPESEEERYDLPTQYPRKNGQNEA